MVRVICGCKLCAWCAGKRRWQTVQDLLPLVDTFKTPRFLTLTFPSLYELTKPELRWMNKCWRRFLAHPFIKGKIRAGVRAFEVTYNELTQTWHPHFHVIYDGAYLPQDKLADLWEKITTREYDARLPDGHPRLEARLLKGATHVEKKWHRDGFVFYRLTKGARVVDIRQVGGKGYREKTRRAAVRELVKYITKVSDYVGDADHVGEFLAAVKGVRQLQKFGEAHSYKPPPRDKARRASWQVDPFTLRGAQDIPCNCENTYWGKEWVKVGLFQKSEAAEIVAGRFLIADPDPPPF